MSTRIEIVKGDKAKLTIRREGRRRKYFSAILEGTHSCAYKVKCKYIDDPISCSRQTERKTIRDAYARPSSSKVGVYNRWDYWLQKIGAFDISVTYATCFFFGMAARLYISGNLYQICIAPSGVSVTPIAKLTA